MYVGARRVMKGAAIGAAGGLVSAWVMSEFHQAWKAASGESNDGHESNTVKVANAVTKATVGASVLKEYRKPAGTAVYYGFGAFLGAIYAVAVELRPATSAGFGTVVSDTLNGCRPELGRQEHVLQGVTFPLPDAAAPLQGA